MTLDSNYRINEEDGSFRLDRLGQAGRQIQCRCKTKTKALRLYGLARLQDAADDPPEAVIEIAGEVQKLIADLGGEANASP